MNLRVGQPARATLLMTLLCAFVSHACASTPVNNPDPERFAREIRKFAQWDSKNAVPRNAVLMTGSSSIRMWATADAFPEVPVINRGFGGSELSDVIHYYEQIVAPYSPAQVFLYAGDNDIGNGKSARQVLADFKAFATRLFRDFPETELIFISIKPSKYRWALWPEMAAANRVISDYSEQHSNIRYADLATPLLNDDGLPQDVYIADGLHLNEAGYALWREALLPFLSGN